MALFVRRRWPKVLAAVAVLAAIVVVVVLMTRDTSSGPPAPLTDPDVETAEPIPEPSPDTVAFDTVASGRSVEQYDGHQVAVTSVPVLSVVGPSAAWIGESAAKRILLVLVNPSEPFTFKAGAKVSFTGTVLRGDDAFGRALGLSGTELAAFTRQGGYVETDAVTAG